MGGGVRGGGVITSHPHTLSTPSPNWKIVFLSVNLPGGEARVRKRCGWRL